MDQEIKDLQSIADERNLTYDAEALFKVFDSQYDLPRKRPINIDRLDYKICKMNELLEVMIDFYGKRTDGGR